MAEQVTAQQGSAIYTLTSPNGFIAVFNDPASGNYVFGLAGEEAVTGLDSPEVRAALYDRIEASGAIAGDFYHGMRPVTLSGELVAATPTARNIKESKLRKVVNDCMLADGVLKWTPDGSIEQFVKVRKYQPTRVRGGFKKDIFTSLVCPDPFIYSTTLSTATWTVAQGAAGQTAENQGIDFGPPVLIRVHGPGTDLTITRTWNGAPLIITIDGALGATEFIDIDPVNKTIKRATDAAPTVYTSVYSMLDYPNTDWWLLGPGNNTINWAFVSGTTAASTLRMDWRATWL